VNKNSLAFPDPLGPEPNVGIFIEDHKKRADSDPNAPPFDDLRNYAYEGGGSTAGSLESLASGTRRSEAPRDAMHFAKVNISRRLSFLLLEAEKSLKSMNLS